VRAAFPKLNGPLVLGVFLIGCTPIIPGSPSLPPGAEGLELTKLRTPEHVPGAPQLFLLEDTGLNDVFSMSYNFEDRWRDDFSGGLAALDCDNDEDIDLFFVNQAGPPRLYINNGNAQFEQAHDSVFEDNGDHSAGATTADIDNDGDADLLVLNHHQPNRMLMNLGNCEFEDRTEELGLMDAYRSTHGTWIDINQDGWLDLFGSNWAGPLAEDELGVAPPPHPDRLFLSDGAGGFHDASASLPSDSQINWGMVTGFFDFDGDGDLDMYQSNDRGNLFVPNRAFRNDGLSSKGIPSWIDTTELWGLENGSSGMGFALSDVDLDGDLDLFHLADREDLYINDGEDFIESGLAWGLLPPDPFNIAWGGTFFDADADGDEDFWYVHSNFFDGPIEDLEAHSGPGRFFQSHATEGGTFTLEEIAGTAGANNLWRGQTAVDLDGDGLQELVHGLADGLPLILKVNPPQDARLVEVLLQGRTSNREGRGAVVRAFIEGRWQTRWPGAVDPVMTGRPASATFGLGGASVIELLEINWPSGQTQQFSDIPAGHRALVSEPEISE
jgi:hypothetical protein